jgi:stage III sporulation protein AG
MDKKKLSLKEIGLPKLAMIFVAGILLILLSVPNIFGKEEAKNKASEPGSKEEQNQLNTTSYDLNTYIAKMEDKLERTLSKVKGIGNVEAMITLKSSKEQVALKDNPYTKEGLNEVDGEGGSRTDNHIQREDSTVLVTNEDGKTVPYIVQEKEPKVEGVVVIAEGGDNPKVIMDIMEAVEVLFDVPAHKVKVMKMSDGIK